jgi:hypothetical protein
MAKKKSTVLPVVVMMMMMMMMVCHSSPVQITSGLSASLLLGHHIINSLIMHKAAEIKRFSPLDKRFNV